MKMYVNDEYNWQKHSKYVGLYHVIKALFLIAFMHLYAVAADWILPNFSYVMSFQIVLQIFV